MKKITINEAIIVEGKYDKIKLSSIIDAFIIQTDGFKVFKDKEKIALIKKIAEKQGIIILTDSDVSGFKIRQFVKSITKSENIKNAYIPQVIGKETRKEHASKENLLGVEGINTEVLKNILIECSTKKNTSTHQKVITKLIFYEDGYIGNHNSRNMRTKLLEYLDLPKYISTNSLLEIINILMSFEEYSIFTKSQMEEL